MFTEGLFQPGRPLKRDLTLPDQFFTPSCHLNIQEDWVLSRVLYKSRTTTPRRSSKEAGILSNELDLLAALPPVPLIDAYIAFDGTLITAVGSYEQVSCFSGLPALLFKGLVSFGYLLALDTSEKMSIKTVLSSMSSNSTSKLELSQNWSQENGLSQMWNPL